MKKSSRWQILCEWIISSHFNLGGEKVEAISAEELAKFLYELSVPLSYLQDFVEKRTGKSFPEQDSYEEE